MIIIGIDRPAASESPGSGTVQVTVPRHGARQLQVTVTVPRQSELQVGWRLEGWSLGSATSHVQVLCTV